jgi:beta-lactamase class A
MFEANGMTRRHTAGLVMALCTAGQAKAAPSATVELLALECGAGGKLGVFAVEVGGGNRTLAWRADDRYLMCSTFKLLAAAATLARADARKENQDRLVRYSVADLVDPHPVTGANVQSGALPLSALCEAAVKESDSTAGNLLLRELGGPQALTAFMRSLGDRVTRVDRYELAANSPQGELDTTSPRAMALAVRKLLFFNALSPGSASRLEEWMRGDRRGARRIRAGIPKLWVSVSKPGTSATSTNDVAIVRPPSGIPLVVAAYYQSAPAELRQREAVLQQAGTAIARWALAS